MGESRDGKVHWEKDKDGKNERILQSTLRGFGAQ